MQFHSRDLRGCDQAVGALQREIRRLVEGALSQACGHAAIGVFLEEMLAIDPVRAAHERQRPVRDRVQRSLAHRLPVGRQVLLGHRLVAVRGGP